jgi:hypothetical protein
MSLINELIWSSSLSTGSGAVGPAAAAVVEACAEAPVAATGAGADTAVTGTDADARVAEEGEFEGARCAQPEMARPMRNAAAHRLATRADWRVTGIISLSAGRPDAADDRPCSAGLPAAFVKGA